MFSFRSRPRRCRVNDSGEDCGLHRAADPPPVGRRPSGEGGISSGDFGITSERSRRRSAAPTNRLSKHVQAAEQVVAPLTPDPPVSYPSARRALRRM